METIFGLGAVIFTLVSIIAAAGKAKPADRGVKPSSQAPSWIPVQTNTPWGKLDDSPQDEELWSATPQPVTSVPDTAPYNAQAKYYPEFVAPAKKQAEEPKMSQSKPVEHATVSLTQAAPKVAAESDDEPEYVPVGYRQADILVQGIIMAEILGAPAAFKD